MREVVFTLTYEAGADRVADAFRENPDLVASSITCTVTEDGIWYLDRVTGPTDALAALDDVYLDPEYCNECLDAPRCHTTWTYDVLASDDRHRTIYAHGTNAEDCHSIPHLAATSVGDGLLYDTGRQGAEYEWRILLPEAAPVGDLFERIRAEMRPGIHLELDRLDEPVHWGGDATTAADVPAEQRALLIEAVERGYFETPRRVTTRDLAESLDVPQSTVQYRLARATAWLAERFVAATSVGTGGGRGDRGW